MSDIDPRPDMPIAPDKRTTETVGCFLRNGRLTFMGADVECAHAVNKGAADRYRSRERIY
ncbi:hypothetical protein [Ruegeria faecimaris]|uniref:hypothetical protein n=1 Tax=Ruegeria faecimaris TaxID=686389 RepID=UPI001FE2FB34|nr:hypothetical protein [Ruegeria faecimaris]